MGNSRRILIVSAVSGSGHRVTAQALASVLRARCRNAVRASGVRPGRRRLTTRTSEPGPGALHASDAGPGRHSPAAKAPKADTSGYTVKIAPVHRILGTFNYIGELFYNFCLMHRMIWLVGAYHRLSKKLIRLYRPFLLAAIRRYFRSHRYDTIVSCVPWVNHYFIRAVPHIPLVTVITDFCDSETHPWIQHKKQYLICPTAKSVAQARSFGIPECRIYQVSGNIISPAFYTNGVRRSRALAVMRRGDAAASPATWQNAAAPTRGTAAAQNTTSPGIGPSPDAAALQKLGLDPARKTAMVFYGGYGPDFMEELVRAIEDWNVIVIWGGNKKRVEKQNCVNIGFTHNVPYYMRLADLLIGKPGPGVIAEAVHCNLPVLVDASRNSVLPQERDVLEWIHEAGAGTFFRSLADFKRKISAITDKDLEYWRNATESIQNNALFEAAGVIKRVVDGQ